MEPEELARQLAFLAASDDPEVQAQAKEAMQRLESFETAQLIRSGGRPEDIALAQARVDSVFETLSRFGQRVGSVASAIQDAFQESEFLNPTTEEGGLIGSGTGQGIGRGLRAAAEATRDFVDPVGAASRFARDQLPQTPTTAPATDIQQQAAAQATNTVPQSPLPGLGPDIQQQAAAASANQAGALQAINQQGQLVSQLQAQQLQYAVQQDELQRISEMLRLIQVPGGNPNALNNAAAFSQAPAVSGAPNNLTTLLPQQQSIGSVSLASALPATQTNINQRQRTAGIEQPFVNASVQEQERALELARQAYIDNVANGIFQRPR